MEQTEQIIPPDLFGEHPRNLLERGKSEACICGDHHCKAEMYFLWDGAVRAYRITHDGKEMTTGLYSTEFEWTLICVCGDHNHFEALRPSTYIKISSDSAARALAQYPAALEEVLRQILERFESAFRAQEDLAFRDVATRLAHLLLTLGEQFGQPSQDGTSITLKLSQDKLARMISTSRPTLNIALKSLTESGAITLKKKKITLIDAQKLREFS